MIFLKVLDNPNKEIVIKNIDIKNNIKIFFCLRKFRFLKGFSIYLLIKYATENMINKLNIIIIKFDLVNII